MRLFSLFREGFLSVERRQKAVIFVLCGVLAVFPQIVGRLIPLREILRKAVGRVFSPSGNSPARCRQTKPP
jgi:hypothetical protein